MHLLGNERSTGGAREKLYLGDLQWFSGFQGKKDVWVFTDICIHVMKPVKYKLSSVKLHNSWINPDY